MIRKGQARWVSGSDVRQQIQFINKLFEVAASDGAWSTQPVALLLIFESCNTSEWTGADPKQLVLDPGSRCLPVIPDGVDAPSRRHRNVPRWY